MTFQKSEVVRIPTWLFSILVPFVMGIIGGLLFISTAKASLETTVNSQAKQIEALQQSKVDRNELNLIIGSLNRIESKLDQHINNN